MYYHVKKKMLLAQLHNLTEIQAFNLVLEAGAAWYFSQFRNYQVVGKGLCFLGREETVICAVSCQQTGSLVGNKTLFGNIH